MDGEAAVQAVLACIGFGALGTAIGWTFGYRSGRADGINEVAAAVARRSLSPTTPVEDPAAEVRAATARAMNMPPFMEEAMRNAPSLFEQARRSEAMRQSIQCEHAGCSEATMLRCSDCGRRYCMQHRDASKHECYCEYASDISTDAE